MTAAIYAHDHPFRGPRLVGKPVVLRRVVRAEEVVLRFMNASQETIVVPPEGAALDAVEVLTADPRVIAGMCKCAADAREENLERRLRVVALPEEELWAGWRGPDDPPDDEPESTGAVA